MKPRSKMKTHSRKETVLRKSFSSLIRPAQRRMLRVSNEEYVMTLEVVSKQTHKAWPNDKEIAKHKERYKKHKWY